ncbi:MAG: hypothetical protein ACI8W7_004999 [Gammaproteobacteria bacterium]|jgi:hypothetical protein
MHGGKPSPVPASCVSGHVFDSASAAHRNRKTKRSIQSAAHGVHAQLCDVMTSQLMKSTFLKLACTGAGLALLAWLLTQVDTAAVLHEVFSVGFIGFATLLALYLVEFTFDVLSWQLTISKVPMNVQWTVRLFLTRIAGEAYNVITPLAGMGGEPIKALILQQRYNVPYASAGASLVLAKTMNVFALVVFLGIGFAMMLDDTRISEQLKSFAMLGLIGLSVGIGGFIAVQRLNLASRIASRFESRRPALAKRMAAIEAFDAHLANFYSASLARFAAVLAISIGNWIFGALGIWATMHFINSPISFTDAWIIEAMAQMVRASTFFIPASIGAQEGAIMLFTAALTGQASSGLAVALLRRAREILWVLAGLCVSARLLGRWVP